MTGSVLVVGTGLIGTSIALALTEDRRVLLQDADDQRLSQAAARGAGAVWDGEEPIDLAVVCVPPAATAEVIAALLRRDVATSITHVAGTQSRVQRDLETLAADVGAVCGGHPLAGRETAGPESASADLFMGRPWVACPSSRTGDAALQAVLELAGACGADPVVMSALEHDRAVAISSHLPQVAASALAGRLATAPAAAVAVSGPGLQDTTRIAASDPALWTEVLSGNAAQVAPLVRALADDLAAAAAALEALAADPDAAGAADAVRALLHRGNEGRQLVPVKRGSVDADLAAVAVRLADRPGQLANLLQRAADAGVNVEDLRVEHLPGRPTGVVELLVRAEQAPELAARLRAGGFDLR